MFTNPPVNVCVCVLDRQAPDRPWCHDEGRASRPQQTDAPLPQVTHPTLIHTLAPDPQ